MVWSGIKNFQKLNMQRNRAALLVMVANEKALASREPNKQRRFLPDLRDRVLPIRGHEYDWVFDNGLSGLYARGGRGYVTTSTTKMSLRLVLGDHFALAAWPWKPCPCADVVRLFLCELSRANPRITWTAVAWMSRTSISNARRDARVVFPGV